MEVEESRIESNSKKPPINDSQTSLQRHPKKKRSAISKLAEKKRLSSESGSEFGSTYSLKSNSSKVVDTAKETPSSSHLEENTDTTNTKTEKLVKTTDITEVSKEKEGKNSPPKPKPRVKKNVIDKAELSPPPMDIDYESDDDVKNGNNNSNTISNKAPSDATIHRFRALKMANANERTNSVESLKKSPFMPKPPVTPKGEKVKSEETVNTKSPVTPKGEKRNRDPYSSSEEPEIETKSQKQSSSYTSLKDMDEDFPSNIPPSVPKKEKKERKHPRKLDLHKTVESDDELKAVKSKYEELLGNDKMPPRGDDSTLSTPRGGRLSPISPKNHPPPLPDISSHVLKTAYKNDPSYTLNKYFGSPVASGRNPFDKMTSGTQLDNMSQQSYSSTAIIQPITIREARLRSGSNSGNVSVTSTLLSASELDRYFPDRRLKVWIGSWNMGDLKECRESIEDFLLPEASEFVQDIYAIGTQENNLNKKEWEVMIQTTLGPSHVLFYSATHGALHLAIFIRRDLIWFCSEPEDDLVTTRAVTMVKTKGAVAISFSFFGTSFLFINSHLASDAGKLKERISDYQKINSSLKLPKSVSGSQSNLQGDATSKFDAVFWFGDLNFRLEKGRHTVDSLVHAIIEQEHPNFEDLLLGDELGQCILNDTAFQGYVEGRINFKPTYKFDINKDDYDTSPKSRIPSYTDRILFHAKKKNSISCIHYDAVMNLRMSDHRPVYGLYEAALRPGRENVQLAAGKFDRDVYMQANRRRAVQQANTPPSQKSSGVCSIQ